MTLAELDLSPWALRAFAFAWGAVWGSFVNVVVWRVPRGESLVRPGSHCHACGKPVAPLDNVPIVSWLLLRGRARCCGVRISPRYLVVEAIAALVGVAVYEVVVRGMPPGTSLYHAGVVFLADFGLAMGLLAAAFIDAEHMYLPDPITLGGTLLGLATPGLRGLHWMDAIVGAAVGFVGVWLPFVVLYKLVRGRHGMGLGDAKLMMLAGAWFGWPGVVFAVCAGAVQGMLATLVMLAVLGKIEEPASVKKDREELQKAAAEGDAEAARLIEQDPLARAPADGLMATPIPFGPFLCLAMIEWMLAAPWIVDRWAPWLAT